MPKGRKKDEDAKKKTRRNANEEGSDHEDANLNGENGGDRLSVEATPPVTPAKRQRKANAHRRKLDPLPGNLGKEYVKERQVHLLDSLKMKI